MDLFDTYTLLMLVKGIEKASSFLRDRYFPTNEATDVFKTEKVLAEYKDGDNRMAPFVSPRKGGVTMLRQGSFMEEYTPPNIAPGRPLTLDELSKRGFGEALLSNLTPEQRESVMLMRDAEELDRMITRREEHMAAQTMQNNGCVMRHYADKGDEYQEMELRFYEGAANPAVYTPAVPWNQPGAKILSDCANMARSLSARGLGYSDILIGPDVADVLQNDEDIIKKLDTNNFHLGGIDPQQLPDDVTKIARLNCSGFIIDFLCYQGQYQDDDGTMKYHFRDGKVVMSAPNAGRTCYGAVSQLEEHDKRFHTYFGRRIPKHVANASADEKDFFLKARPLMLPNNRDPWTSADVL